MECTTTEYADAEIVMLVAIEDQWESQGGGGHQVGLGRLEDMFLLHLLGVLC
jgi:hypothetical protein